MKKTLTLLLLISCHQLIAQITIDDNDMPSPGDIIILSEASPQTPNVDPLPSGANYTWDFSFLTYNTQRADTFLAVSSTGAIYSFYYINSSFNPNRANVALKGLLPAFQGLPVTDVYNFFYNSSTEYHQTGFGATLNGIQIPVSYGDKDVIYKFPLDYNDQDTSFSDLSVSVPNTGSLNSSQTRINHVDGWGSVITPLDTFNCLRLVSVVTGHDSIYVDSLAQGLGFDRLLTREYKWLAKNIHAPVLQINTQELIPGIETVISITYLDTLHVTASLNENNIDPDLLIYPNPVSEKLFFNAKQFSGNAVISLESVTGATVLSRRVSLLNGERTELDVEAMDAGIYIFKLTTGDQIAVRKVMIVK